MRKHLHSDLRSSRPLHLEIFEDRCLLSGTNSLLALPLLSTATPPSGQITTPAVTQLAAPALGSLGVTASAVRNALSGAGTAATAFGLVPALNLGLGSVANIVSTVSSTVTALALGASASLNLANTPLANALAIVTNSVAAVVPEVAALTTTPSLPVSISAQVTPTVVAGSVTVDTSRVNTGADLRLTTAGGGQVDVGSGSVPPALEIGPVTIITVSDGGTGGSSGNVRLDTDLVPLASSNQMRIAAVEQGPGQLQPQISVSAGVGGPGLTLDSGADLGLRGSEESVGLREAEIVVQLVNGLHEDDFRALADSLPTAEAVGQADVGRQESKDTPAAGNQGAITGGASDLDDASPIPTPRTEAVLADLLPLNLASLEADLQTFLAQLEQLGGELSSLLGRMNLSPWLMAIAVAAIAGEVARRLQRSQHGRLLAAADGATLAWFPELSGPWSGKEP